MLKTTIVPTCNRRQRALGVLFIVLFAASQALLWFAYYGHGAKPLIGDEANYQASALAILGGGAWMPSTIWPPLQPLLLAAIYAIFGVHLLAAQIAQTLLFVACAALLRDLWRRLGGSVAAATLPPRRRHRSRSNAAQATNSNVCAICTASRCTPKI